MNIRSRLASLRRVVPTKSAADVLHDPRALEAYLDAYLKAQGVSFATWARRFGDEPYASRNRAMVAAMRSGPAPKRVFEFACAAGFLAEAVMGAYPSVEAYVISNFSPRMISYTAQQLREYPQCTVRLLDAEDRAGGMHPESLAAFDTFLSTSFEHIQHDLELIDALPHGARFTFSVACFDDVEHFRVFHTPAQLRTRYGELLEIDSIWRATDHGKMVVNSRKP